MPFNNYCYSLITLNKALPNWHSRTRIQCLPLIQNRNKRKFQYYPFDIIRTWWNSSPHHKAIKIMMQKFQRHSQGSSRYTVHGMKERWTSQSVHTFKARFFVMAENTCRQFLPQKFSLKYSQREVWQLVISAMTGNPP